MHVSLYACVFEDTPQIFSSNVDLNSDKRQTTKVRKSFSLRALCVSVYVCGRVSYDGRL